jgi:hypothetical protein
VVLTEVTKKNGRKYYRMTNFKFAKKVNSKCWFLKSEWSISNDTPTLGFIRHLSLLFN